MLKQSRRVSVSATWLSTPKADRMVGEKKVAVGKRGWMDGWMGKFYFLTSRFWCTFSRKVWPHTHTPKFNGWNTRTWFGFQDWNLQISRRLSHFQLNQPLVLRGNREGEKVSFQWFLNDFIATKHCTHTHISHKYKYQYHRYFFRFIYIYIYIYIFTFIIER